MINPKDAFSLKGHTCLITGSARGIGRGLADSVGAAGANVIIVDQRQADTDRAAQEVAESTGVQTLGIQCDVRDSRQVDRMFELSCEKLAVPDLSLNNAGIALVKDSVDVTDDEWNNILAVNLSGPFFCCRAFARTLEKHDIKTGSIVNLVSISHSITPLPPRETAYNASKAGLLMLSKALAVEWIDRGIRINTISPGYMYTEMISDEDPELLEEWKNAAPIKRMGVPDDLAGALILLFSGASSYAVGTDIIVDGGYTCI